MKISLDKCRTMLLRQNITLAWHVNSQAPNILSQSWDFAVVAGCPLRRSAHCSWQLRSSPPQKHSAELETRRGQRGWAKAWNRFCGDPPLCGLPQASVPQMPLKSTSWRTNSCNSGSVSCVLSQTQLGCWAQVLCAGSAEVAWNCTPEGGRLLVYLIPHCPPVCAEQRK